MTLYNSLSDVAIARMTLTIDGLALKHEIADDIAFDSSPLWGGLLSAQIIKRKIDGWQMLARK